MKDHRLARQRRDHIAECMQRRVDLLCLAQRGTGDLSAPDALTARQIADRQPRAEHRVRDVRACDRAAQPREARGAITLLALTVAVTHNSEGAPALSQWAAECLEHGGCAAAAAVAKWAAACSVLRRACWAPAAMWRGCVRRRMLGTATCARLRRYAHADAIQRPAHATEEECRPAGSKAKRKERARDNGGGNRWGANAQHRVALRTAPNKRRLA